MHKKRSQLTKIAERVFIGYQIDAMALSEDLQTIRDVLRLLKRIDCRSISRDSTFAERAHQVTVAQIRSWERYAERRLRDRYLRV